jgi:hypothetical protein
MSRNVISIINEESEWKGDGAQSEAAPIVISPRVFGFICPLGSLRTAEHGDAHRAHLKHGDVQE